MNDERSVEAVIAAHADEVYRLAFAQTRSRSDADDIFQDVFLRYVEKHPAFESREHEKAWFLRVTLNCCKDLWRAPWRKRNVPMEDSMPFETREEWELDEELRRLPKKYRAVLHLFYWEDLPTDKIAEIVGCSPDTVRQRLHRARQLLKKFLTEEDNENAEPNLQ